MKNIKTVKLFFVVLGLFTFINGYSQCDTIVNVCDNHITSDYISDGQVYRSLLLDDQIAEFHTSLFGDTKYRIAACSGLTDGNLIFRVFDKERNLLFTNSEYSNAPYWDFEVKETLNCIIEAQLDPTASESGCAVLLIGFKQ